MRENGGGAWVGRLVSAQYNEARRAAARARVCAGVRQVRAYVLLYSPARAACARAQCSVHGAAGYGPRMHCRVQQLCPTSLC
ncbi:hypothetical protein EON67_00845 [archaeon]|nr:MAG: hypothetical protein EON67_00845 [archaeon]